MKIQDKDALIVLAIMIVGALCLMAARVAPRTLAGNIAKQHYNYQSK